MEKEIYLKKRSVAEFLRWIEETNIARQGNSIAYRNREGLLKKYADEAEPLGRFLRGSLRFPEDATVSMRIKSSEPDAVILLGNEEVPFEITTTDHPGSVLNRKQLNARGFGTGETNFVKTGKELATEEAKGFPLTSSCVKN